jgi:hypothetical protein
VMRFFSSAHLCTLATHFAPRKTRVLRFSKPIESRSIANHDFVLRVSSRQPIMSFFEQLGRFNVSVSTHT